MMCWLVTEASLRKILKIKKFKKEKEGVERHVKKEEPKCKQNIKLIQWRLHEQPNFPVAGFPTPST